MEIHRYRFWCSKCKDFTIHLPGEEGGCTTCGTVTKTYKMSEVPEEKILEQQKRYREKQMNSYLKYLQPQKSIFEEMFSEEIGTTVIHEDDAGWKEISEQRAQAREDARREIREAKEEYDRLYSHLGRNDLCSCGSGKKFKHCHIKQ